MGNCCCLGREPVPLECADAIGKWTNDAGRSLAVDPSGEIKYSTPSFDLSLPAFGWSTDGRGVISFETSMLCICCCCFSGRRFTLDMSGPAGTARLSVNRSSSSLLLVDTVSDTLFHTQSELPAEMQKAGRLCTCARGRFCPPAPCAPAPCAPVGMQNAGRLLGEHSYGSTASQRSAQRQANPQPPRQSIPEARSSLPEQQHPPQQPGRVLQSHEPQYRHTYTSLRLCTQVYAMSIGMSVHTSMQRSIHCTCATDWCDDMRKGGPQFSRSSIKPGHFFRCSRCYVSLEPLSWVKWFVFII